jgi:F420-0:gamma-glutamyl ligase-like protein
VTAQDDLVEVIRAHAATDLRLKDVLFLSERMVAITQGRAYRIADIRPSGWAGLLYRFIYRSPYGIGLGSPWTMELAIREAGLFRVLCAAAAAAVTRPLGLRGVFYRVAGTAVAAIDGPCSYTLPPYDGYAVLGPADPAAVAARLRAEFGVGVVVIDANDLGVKVLAVSDTSVDVGFAERVFRDNPLGQGRQQTPIGIVRAA